MKAEYIDHMGSDLRVANAARVSMNKEKSTFDASDERIIKYLATGLTNKDRDHIINDLIEANDPNVVHEILKRLDVPVHFTPFTHCMITLRETVPIFVARQRFKHTIGFTYNELSRRYVDDTPDFFTPDEWRGRPEGNIKQGSGEVHKDNEWYKDFYSIYIKGDNSIEDSGVKNLYDMLIREDVAPEQARMILPQSMMTSYYVTGSLMAFARAYKLRADSHSQKEIQVLAKQWDQIIRPLFPVSWAALVGETE